MKKGKSIYTFKLNCSPNLADNLIQSYIQANKYSLQSKNGEQFFKAGDAMLWYTYFNYDISGQTLTIYAWLKGLLGPVAIEKNSLNMLAMSYRNSLNTLFQGIAKLNSSEEISNKESLNDHNYVNASAMANQNNNQTTSYASTVQAVKNNTQQPIQNAPDELAKTFQEETMKKQEKMCEIGFWLSIGGVVCALGGVTYGILVYIMDFYFASQGLKTRKRGKAIATIVLSIISILITILQLIIVSLL